MHYGEKLGAHPWADLAASKRNKPVDDAGQGDLLLLLLLWLLGNGSSSSSGKHQCQSSRDQELWVSSWVLQAGGSPGHPEQLGPGGSRCSPSKWKVCLFLGYRLSGRKDGHCQGFYWIPVKGIERVSCLLSFPAPAVVKEVFYLRVGGRDTGIWHPALW